MMDSGSDTSIIPYRRLRVFSVQQPFISSVFLQNRVLRLSCRRGRRSDPSNASDEDVSQTVESASVPLSDRTCGFPSKHSGQSQRPQKPSVPPLISVTFQISASPPVENRLCQGPVPNRSQLCQIPCPIDCQVSPWGAWGPCTFENCDDQTGKKGFKLRRTTDQQRAHGGPGQLPPPGGGGAV
ncbi:Thrombospondin type-1 domain-containing protein 7A [Oryzias melastigma]|uniref:Thrombospondin type-1 domain-containing protein 7A n=1 Tax=Oryzias melastigma TaxID=30732 RepID=A0A834CFU6_ORYME|nr:Thrombospondin type-1 domain-containing protein 7A [Oryzias melastigma]